MKNNVLVNTAIALLFGGVAMALPSLSFFAGFDSSVLLLTQLSALAISGVAITSTIMSKGNGGIAAILAGIMLVFSGFMISANIGSTPIEQSEAVDYTFDSNFNGTFTNMEESNSLLQLVDLSSSGTFQSDQVYSENGSIEFNRLEVDMETFDNSTHTTDLRVRTYDSGSLATTHTYTIEKEGVTGLNVSKINSLSEVNSFEYEVSMDTSGSKSPQLDSVYFETKQTYETTSNTGGILQYMALLIFVFGGIVTAIIGA